MHQFLARRRALPALTVLTVAAALAGCGGDDASTSSSAGGSADSTADAPALLRDSFRNVSLSGKPISSGAFSVKISGKVDAPKDKDVQKLSGTATIDLAFSPVQDRQLLPPFSLAFTAKGDYVDGRGKAGKADYDGGFLYTGKTFFAKWDGTDYAVGDEFSKQILSEIEKEANVAGGTSPYDLANAQKFVDALDLDASTWVQSPKAEDGGTLDGVETTKISGPVDVKAVADDVTQGLRNLAKTMPAVPGVKELGKVTDASAADIKEVQDAVSTLDMSVWVGKDDKVQRKSSLHVVFDTKDDDGEPLSGDITIETTGANYNKPQSSIKAPAQTQPITDLFLKVQKEFPGLFGGAQSAAGGATGA